MRELKRARKYYSKSPETIDRTIRELITTEDIILHGGRALNAQLPDYLDKPTEDWDLLAENAKNIAYQLEHLLDTRYGGNFFEVAPARHEGTYKVISLVTKRVVADITIPEGPISSKTLNGINVATLDYHVKHIEETLRDPKASYRWDKDREVLQRINIHKAEQGVLPTDLPGLST